MERRGGCGSGGLRYFSSCQGGVPVERSSTGEVVNQQRLPPYNITPRSHDTVEVTAAVVRGESDDHYSNAPQPLVVFMVVCACVRLEVLKAVDFDRTLVDASNVSPYHYRITNNL